MTLEIPYTVKLSTKVAENYSGVTYADIYHLVIGCISRVSYPCFTVLSCYALKG